MSIQVSKDNLDSIAKLLEYTISKLGHQAISLKNSGNKA
jgi:hypothetical protein